MPASSGIAEGPSIAIRVTQPLAIEAPAPASAPQRICVVPVRTGDTAKTGLADRIYSWFEFAVATLGLLVGLPLMAVVAVLIRIDSPGPILFRHRRPARSRIVRGRELQGRPDFNPPPGGFEPDELYYVPRYFYLVKFRTMHVDAATRFPQYYSQSRFSDGDFRAIPFKISNDPRVTRVGRLLRKLSLDELPNLWSVLVGDMRLVGPRPEDPYLLSHYTPDEMYKFSCKPGITGLAQVHGRSLLTCGETIAWDLQYIRSRTVTLDLQILLATIRNLFTGAGAF